MTKNKMIETLEILESLPFDWEWTLNRHGKWYHCVIRNDGLRREPVYSSNVVDDATDALRVVKFTYNQYLNGEQAAESVI